MHNLLEITNLVQNRRKLSCICVVDKKGFCLADLCAYMIHGHIQCALLFSEFDSLYNHLKGNYITIDL